MNFRIAYHTGPTQVTAVAKAVRALGWNVVAEGTETVFLTVPAEDETAALLKVREALGRTVRVSARQEGSVNRYVVEHRTAYGRVSFAVIDMQRSGERGYVVARCDSSDDAHKVCALLESYPLPRG